MILLRQGLHDAGSAAEDIAASAADHVAAAAVVADVIPMPLPVEGVVGSNSSMVSEVGQGTVMGV